METMSCVQSPRGKSKSPALGIRARLLRLAAGCAVALAAVLGTGSANADTDTPLTKGHSADEPLPVLPAARGNDDGWLIGEPEQKPESAPGEAQTAPPASDPTGDEFADTDPSALDDFQQPLAPYGQWVEDATYGTVWVPNSSVVGSDFAPYQTAGHWSLTAEDDWYWASDYDWGYIPFHYGRWVWVGGYGWSWIPGRTYAPAWVSWRVGELGYIGWAPMPPSWYWWDGVAVSLWAVPPAAFCFVPTAYVLHDHVTTYIIHDRAGIQRAAGHTRPYTPASPGAHQGAKPHTGGSPASPGAASSHGPRAASPSMKEAHLPPSAAPRARVRPDGRALALARPSTSPSRALPRSFDAMPSRRGGDARPSWRTFDSRPGYASPDRGRGFRSPPAAGRPQIFPSQPPSRGFSPSARPPSSGYRPTPAFRPSAPSAPVFRPSAPAARPSTTSRPVVRPSAPAVRPSAPAVRAPSRGGRHR